MNEKIDKIVKRIENLPEPGDLDIVLKKLNEFPNLGITDIAEKLTLDYLKSQPSKQATYILNVQVKSRHGCERCGEFINNGYFKVIFASLSDSEKIEISNQIIMSFDSYHQMKVHYYYDEKNSAVDSDISDLEQENNLKNPRDQVNRDEILAQIRPYSLNELENLLN